MYLRNPFLDILIAIVLGLASGFAIWRGWPPDLQLAQSAQALATVGAIASGFSGVAVTLQRTGRLHREFEKKFPGLLRRTWMHGVIVPFLACIGLALTKTEAAGYLADGWMVSALALILLPAGRVAFMMDASLRLSDGSDKEAAEPELENVTFPDIGQ